MARSDLPRAAGKCHPAPGDTCFVPRVGAAPQAELTCLQCCRQLGKDSATELTQLGARWASCTNSRPPGITKFNSRSSASKAKRSFLLDMEK